MVESNPDRCSEGCSIVYGLELAGQDDAFAAREAATACSSVEIVAPGLATARGLDPDRFAGLAYTRAAIDLVAKTTPSIEAARTALEVASIDRRGTVAVRARDVRGSSGVSTAGAERELGAVLVDRGFEVDLDDPDHELRVLFSDDIGDDASIDSSTDSGSSSDRSNEQSVCLLGWLAAETVRDYGDRRPTDRPFFQPGSMAPLDARAIANLAGAAPGRRFVDPMCGTGGILLEAALVGADVFGVDAQPKMVRGTRQNLDALVPERSPAVLLGDATALPFPDDVADAIAFDAPYGRQSKIARHELVDLVRGALSESRRIAPRGVMVADRSWEETATDVGWTVERRFERRVHGSLVRHVHVLRK